MALKWSISHGDRLVVFEVTGKPSANEMQSALAAVVAEGALPYRKLFDARFAAHDPDGSSLRWLSSIAASAAKNIALGPVAVVSGLDIAADIAGHLNRKADTDRPLRIFRDVASARHWLDDVAPARPGASINPNR